TEPIAVIANQQIVPTGATSFTPIPPFSSYSGFDAGSLNVTLPVIQHNWYQYYTEFYVQNVGSDDASVTVTYYPGSDGTDDTGASGVSESATIKQYASEGFSQEAMTELGAPSGNPYVGRFLGSAKVESDQPVVVVVNQNNVGKY